MKQGLEELKHLKRKKAELEQKLRTVKGQIEETTIDLVEKKLPKQKTKPKRLTIGMRVRILTLAELSKKLGKKCKYALRGFGGADYFWNHHYGGKHALLKKRSSGGGGFSILTIGNKWKNERILPKETTGVIDGGGAWVHEDVMEFINADFNVNLDYMDWYEEHEHDFCGDCGVWRPDAEGTICPNKDCPGNHEEDYLDD
jgi:hypothetical protein